MPPRDRQTLDLFGNLPKTEPLGTPVDLRPAPTPRTTPRPTEAPKPQHVHIDPVKANVEPPDDPGLPYWVQSWWINSDEAYRTKPKDEVLGYETAAIEEHEKRHKLKDEPIQESIARLAKLKADVIATPEHQALKEATKALRDGNKLVGVGPVLRGDHGPYQVTVSDRPDLVHTWRKASKALDALIQSLGGRPGDIHRITI